MRKLFFSFVIAMLLVSSVAFAQQSRSLRLYLDANSGNIVRNGGINATGMFEGNEFEFGAIYMQNFESAQWLSFRLRMRAITSQMGEYENASTGVLGTAGELGESIGAYKGIDDADVFGRVDAQAGLMLNSASLGFDGLYVGLYIDTRLLTAFEASYTLSFGAAGGLTFGTVVEFWANPFVFQSDPNLKLPGTPGADMGDLGERFDAYYVLDVFALSIGYSVPFAEMWNYSTTFQLRFNGPQSFLAGQVTSSSFAAASGVTYDVVKAWESNFLSGLELRWDNVVSVNLGGLGLWAGVRWDIEKLVSDFDYTPINLREDRGEDGNPGRRFDSLGNVVHDVRLRAGVNYTFNFSDL